MRLLTTCCTASLVVAGWLACGSSAARADHIRDVQTQAIEQGRSDAAHWGTDPNDYTQWGTHSNRLVPVYTFGTRGAGPGIDLDSYTGANSPFRSERQLRRIFGQVPTNTLNPDAEYLDQINIFDIQKAALDAGRKHIFLVVFDGMDWQTTRAASIARLKRVAYDSGRGTGFHFQDYTAGGTTQFGYMVTTPHNDGTLTDVDKQVVLNPGGTQPGGYNAAKGGPNPWTPGNDPEYLIGKSGDGLGEHAYPDSAPTAAAMTTGVKSYNSAINVDPTGAPLTTIAHLAQEEGYRVGAVTSVPISHATPAAAYAHNVDRDDYQDLTRDQLGLPSIAHPERPLPGLDVLIGTGWGSNKQEIVGQGENVVPGNPYITDDDLRAIDRENGGRYVIALRTKGKPGGAVLENAARKAAESGNRLFGFFGVASTVHLPFRTVDGNYDPTVGRKKTAETYTPADLRENPTLADMTRATLNVLSKGDKGFWLMVESGDVDWANHDNNLDNSAGAVVSGDMAIEVITRWVEANSNWDESLLIVTADHGHYLFLDDPERLVPPADGE